MPCDESLLDCWSGLNKALINMIVVVCFLKRHTRASVCRDWRSSAKSEAPKVHDGGSGQQRKRPVINASESTASQPASAGNAGLIDNNARKGAHANFQTSFVTIIWNRIF